MNNKQPIKNQIPEEALRLLPWYATGWLSPEERNIVKKALSEFPELQELLLTEHQIINLIKEDKSILDESLLAPAEKRLDQVLKKIEKLPASNKEESFTSKINNYISSFMLGSSGKAQYAVIAAVSTLSIALLFAFISPLIKQQGNVFRPATIETPTTDRLKSVTILLVGLNTTPDDPILLKVLQESEAEINAVPGKDGMYRIRLTKKLNPSQTDDLIKKLSAHKNLFWFAGEDY